MRVRGGRYLIGLAAAVAGLGAGPGPEFSRFEYAETHMGSQFRLLLYSLDEPTARRASRAAFDRIADLDAKFSDYQPDSELMRLCDRAGGPPVAVSADLFDILRRARAISERSHGAFDVTVGPVVRLWRRARRDRKLPRADLLERALGLVGYDRVKLDPDARTVQLFTPGMKLDLGGIAKGYASQAAIDVLKARGVPRALAAGAGDIVVGDPPPGRDGWVIGIGSLDAPGARPRRYISLKNAAVSTAGDAERFVEIGGKRYAHIVDPRTGLGVVDRASVTVVAPDGATADALDTAAYVLGPQQGLALVESIEGAAALIVRATARGTETFESARFKLIPPGQPTSGPSERLSP